MSKHQVMAKYKGVEVAGIFDEETGGLTVTDPLRGRYFPSPTTAAMAVVEALNPKRAHTNTNGWRFWRLVHDNAELSTLRRT